MSRYQLDDWDDGTDDNGGNPRTTKKKWLDINWSFPLNAPTPLTFTVAAYTGSDPLDTSAYLFPPIQVPGTDRRLVKAITPNANLTGINAAVRADYA